MSKSQFVSFVRKTLDDNIHSHDINDDVIATNASAGTSTQTVDFEPCAQPLPHLSCSVDEEEKKLLREILLENVCLNAGTTSMLGIGVLVNVVDADLMEELVTQSLYIFCTTYLLDNRPILSVQLAKRILSIFNEIFGDIEEHESMQFVENTKSDTLMASLQDWCTGFDEDDECDDCFDEFKY